MGSPPPLSGTPRISGGSVSTRRRLPRKAWCPSSQLARLDPGVGGMVIFGGRKRFYGANPWSMGVPATDGALPMVYDGSTSTIAEGKVRVARAKKAQLPPDCIIGPDGAPTTDPEQFYAGGALVPLGGKVAGHKGYGLAMASALIGALAMIDDPDPTLIGAQVRERSPDPRGRIAGVFVIAIDPAAFGDAASYRAMAAEHMAAAKRVPAAEEWPKCSRPARSNTVHVWNAGAMASRCRKRRGAIWSNLRRDSNSRCPNRGTNDAL